MSVELQELVDIVVSALKDQFDESKRSLGSVDVLVHAIEQIDRFLHLNGYEKEALLVLCIESIAKTWNHTITVQLQFFIDQGLIAPFAHAIVTASKKGYDINTMRKQKKRSWKCWQK